MRDANVRNHLKYISSAYFADGDSDGHFKCTEKTIIDLTLDKNVKFIFSAPSVMHNSYNSNVETNMLPFLCSFLCLPCAGLTLRKIPRSTLWLPLTIRPGWPAPLYNLYFDSFLLICTSFVVRTRGIVCVVHLLFRLANYKDPCKRCVLAQQSSLTTNL